MTEVGFAVAKHQDETPETLLEARSGADCLQEDLTELLRTRVEDATIFQCFWEDRILPKPVVFACHCVIAEAWLSLDFRMSPLRLKRM